MTPNHSQFTTAQQFQAELALEGVSGKDRVNFALKLMLDIEDENAAGALSFAARRVGEHATTLNRAAFNAECG
ncbi:MAG: hypothetical protein COB39_03465 [Marinosulfonomonas sp.]|nr:MAG: hypothetical protein COB39_03465 [Marinosulfonomonas sp.]